MITNIKLKQHQIDAVEKAMSVNKFMLVAKPGLGKTLIAMITSIKKFLNSTHNKVLWITPPNLIDNLNSELNKHINMRFHKLFIFISQNQIKKYINKFDNYMLIIDECHNFKNTQNAERANIIFELSDKAKEILIMTGTPKGVNRNADLFYAFKMLINKDAQYNNYIKEFCVRSNGKIVDSKNTDLLLKLFEPYSIWIDKSTLGLPAKNHNIIQIQINNDMKELISNVALYNVFEYKNKKYIKTSFTSLALNSGRLLAKTEGKLEILDIKTNKENKFIQLINNIQGQSIIYYFFKFELDIIINILNENKYTYAVRNGEMNNKEKNESINKFLNGEVQYLVASIQSSNMGLTLINSNNIIYYNTSFSPTELEQSQDRIHRIGQKNECNYYYLANGAINNCIIQSQLDLIDQADKMFKFGGDIESFDYNKLMTKLARKSEVELLERINIQNELLDIPKNKKNKNIPILFKFNDVYKKDGNYYIKTMSGLHKRIKSIKYEIFNNNENFKNYIEQIKNNDSSINLNFDLLEKIIESIIKNNNFNNIDNFDYSKSIINFFNENDSIDPIINHQHIADFEVGYADTLPLLAYDVKNELSFYDFILYDINNDIINAMKKRNKIRNKILMARANMKINKAYLIQFKKNDKYLLKMFDI